MTPSETITKAANVPIFTISAKVPSGINPAINDVYKTTDCSYWSDCFFERLFGK